MGFWDFAHGHPSRHGGSSCEYISTQSFGEHTARDAYSPERSSHARGVRFARRRRIRLGRKHAVDATRRARLARGRDRDVGDLLSFYPSSRRRHATVDETSRLARPERQRGHGELGDERDRARWLGFHQPIAARSCRARAGTRRWSPDSVPFHSFSRQGKIVRVVGRFREQFYDTDVRRRACARSVVARQHERRRRERGCSRDDASERRRV